jgi:hypothetical protein
MLLVGPHPQPLWVMQQLFKQLPADTILVGMSEDFKTQRWGWIFASETFGEIPEGQVIPEMVLKINGIKKTIEVIAEISPANFTSALRDL